MSFLNEVIRSSGADAPLVAAAASLYRRAAMLAGAGAGDAGRFFSDVAQWAASRLAGCSIVVAEYRPDDDVLIVQAASSPDVPLSRCVPDGPLADAEHPAARAVTEAQPVSHEGASDLADGFLTSENGAASQSSDASAPGVLHVHPALDPASKSVRGVVVAVATDAAGGEALGGAGESGVQAGECLSVAADLVAIGLSVAGQRRDADAGSHAGPSPGGAPPSRARADDPPQPARTAARWMTLMDAYPDPIHISVDRVIRYINPAGVRVYGGSDAAEIVGMPIRAFISPEFDFEVFEERARQVYDAETETEPFEHEIRRLDGESRVVETRSVPIEYDGERGALTLVRDVTAQREMEDKLQVTEERIRRLVEHAQPIVFILDENGQFLVCEGRDLDATPFEPGEVVGQSVDEVAARIPEVGRGIRRALRGETCDDRFTIDGATFDVWYAPVRNPDGTIAGCVGMGANVSEQVQAERALRAERDLLERIFETSPTAITILDTEGRIVRANARAEEVLGLTPSQIQNRCYDDPDWHHTTVDGEPFPDAEQPFVRVMESEAPVYDVRHAIVWPDGRRRYLSISGAPVRSSHGEVTGAVFVVQDVTDEILQREMRTVREGKVRALYEATSSLLTATSPEEVARRILDLIEDTMDYTVSAVRLKRGGRLVPVCVSPGIRRHIGWPRPDYAVGGDSIVARAFRAGESAIYDDLSDVQESIDALRGQVASTAYIPIGTYGIIAIGTTVPDGIDAFDVKLVEILARNAESVLSRLRDEDDLRAARDVAEEASRLKSAMLANMSHEVRTPLTSIVGFSEVIREEARDESVRTFARRVYDSSLRLRDTLDSVLHLSRLEAGAVTFDPHPVDLVAEAEATRRELDGIADGAGVSLHLDVPSGPIQCLSDRAAVQRILRNLVGNAVKFTPSGRRVTLRVASGPTGAVTEVCDEGIGMSLAFQRRMFDAFTQESEGRQREHEGSGLGLAIVQKLVDLLNGSIEVESTPGLGTRIAVFLPKTK
jgi:PAS domain S-box-containing protein